MNFERTMAWAKDNPKLALGALMALLLIIGLIAGVGRAEAQVIGYDGFYASNGTTDSDGGAFLVQAPRQHSPCSPPLLCVDGVGVGMAFTWATVCDASLVCRDELRGYVISPFDLSAGEAQVTVARQIARDVSGDPVSCELMVEYPLVPSPGVSQAETVMLSCPELNLIYSDRF